MRKLITSSSSTALVAKSTPATLAPEQASGVPLAVLQPSTAPLDNWSIVGSTSRAKSATNGVGPAPGPNTVGFAALCCITEAGTEGATLQAIQDAVTAVGLKGKHPVMPLLRWLAKERGYSFTCKAGKVTLG